MAVETPNTTVRIKRGETFRFSMAVKVKQTGGAYPLADYAATMDVKTALEGGTTVFSISSGSGLTIDTSNSVISGIFTDAQTASLTAGESYYSDIRLSKVDDVKFSGIIKFVVDRTLTDA